MRDLTVADDKKQSGPADKAAEDVAIWLVVETGGAIILWIEIHPDRATRELSRLVLLHREPEIGTCLRDLARRVIEALECRIHGSGSRTEIIGPMPSSQISAHARLAAVARVWTALERRSRPTEVSRLCDPRTEVIQKPSSRLPRTENSLSGTAMKQPGNFSLIYKKVIHVQPRQPENPLS